MIGKTVYILSLSLMLLVVSVNSYSEQLSIVANDQDGQPLKNVVVSAYPENSDNVQQLQSVAKSPVVIDQIKKKFVNHVTPVQVGTAVSFPNHDQIRHHVYSFSPAKTFEIPLYKGLPAEPIVFDREGVVSLGCNIHDWMSAYVVVVDTPFFTKTDSTGSALLKLPSGHYDIRFWHRDLDRDKQAGTEHVTIAPNTDQKVSIDLNVKSGRFSNPSSISIFNRGFYR